MQQLASVSLNTDSDNRQPVGPSGNPQLISARIVEASEKPSFIGGGAAAAAGTASAVSDDTETYQTCSAHRDLRSQSPVVGVGLAGGDSPELSGTEFVQHRCLMFDNIV